MLLVHSSPEPLLQNLGGLKAVYWYRVMRANADHAVESWFLYAPVMIRVLPLVSRYVCAGATLHGLCASRQIE